MRLTDQRIRSIPFLQSGQRDYADEALSGLALRVGKRTKTFMYLAGKGANRQRQRWPGESGQWAKWIFCLSAARIAADQERA
jgi:hypothetical protein